jgi:hypothetical protein
LLLWAVGDLAHERQIGPVESIVRGQRLQQCVGQHVASQRIGRVDLVGLLEHTYRFGQVSFELFHLREVANCRRVARIGRQRRFRSFAEHFDLFVLVE